WPDGGGTTVSGGALWVVMKPISRMNTTAAGEYPTSTQGGTASVLVVAVEFARGKKQQKKRTCHYLTRMCRDLPTRYVATITLPSSTRICARTSSMGTSTISSLLF
ncbi:unnamed protein product, partial [Ectocarpus sp. 4 AP-2014]